jgi:hypothetical protein
MARRRTIKRAGNAEAALDAVKANSGGLTSNELTVIFQACGREEGTARAELGFGKRRGWFKHDINTGKYTITPLGVVEKNKRTELRRSRGRNASRPLAAIP